MPAVLPQFFRRLSAPKQRRRYSYEKTFGEALESRVMPSAIAAASGSTLNVSSDADGSDLLVENVTGGVKVTAQGTSTLTVGGTPVASFTFNGVTSVNFKLGEGDDSIALAAGLNLKNVSVNLGDGTNVFTATSANITGKLSVTGGTGLDQVTLDSVVGKSASVSLGLGNDEISLLGASFSSTVSLTTGAGADTVTVDQNGISTHATLGNNLTINTGEDNDSVTVHNATTKKISIDTGDDDDTIDLANLTANGAISVQARAGADILNVATVNETVNGTNTFNLGTGADTVTLSDTNVFTGNVSIDLGTGINNSLTVDDTAFNGTFSLVANGSADVINIEQDLAQTGATIFAKAAKLKVGTAADINISAIGVGSSTQFQSTLSVSGVNPAADLTVAAVNTTFAHIPTLVKVNRVDI